MVNEQAGRGGRRADDPSAFLKDRKVGAKPSLVLYFCPFGQPPANSYSASAIAWGGHVSGNSLQGPKADFRPCGAPRDDRRGHDPRVRLLAGASLIALAAFG